MGINIAATASNDADFARINRLAVTASREALSKTLRLVSSEARRRAPEDTNRQGGWRVRYSTFSDGGLFAKGWKPLKQSIRSSVRGSMLFGHKGLFYGSVFTTNGLGGLIETGTGVYGPHRQMIVPRKRKFMWFIGEGGRLVKAKAVRGREGTPYLLPSLKSQAPQMIEALKDGFRKEDIR